jgi:hypothetical protein
MVMAACLDLSLDLQLATFIGETNETGEVVRPMSGLTVSPDGWRKSSLSAAAGECVEFARSTTGEVLLRDSKDPSGPTLTFTPAEWRAFIGGVCNAEFEV